MNRAAISIVGGLMGLATGLAVTRPLAAFLAPTSVTWNASSCPSGTYTITTVARGDDGVREFSVTTKNVSLPKASVVQQFPDLPPGAYRVSALATANNGKAFRSQNQSVDGQGDGSGRFGHSRPVNAPILGTARSRNAPPTPPPTERRSTASSDAARRSALGGGSRQADPIIDSLERFAQRILLRIQNGESIEDLEGSWRHVTALDDDGDGTVDVVTIESVNGDLLIIRLARDAQASGPLLP